MAVESPACISCVETPKCVQEFPLFEDVQDGIFVAAEGWQAVVGKGSALSERATFP